MKKILLPVLLFLILAANPLYSADPGLPPKPSGTPPAGAANEKTAALMFVQSAKEATVEGTKLTLKGINPLVIFFADRPERIAGHLTLPAFLKEWDQGKDSFAKDPPNATLSTVADDKISYAVVEIMNPKLNGQDLTYDIRVLDGTPPAKGGLSSLFIDWYYVGFGGPNCYRSWYTGAVYCHRPGWYYRPPGWYY